jgi:hypothetical protein
MAPVKTVCLSTERPEAAATNDTTNAHPTATHTHNGPYSRLE